jgi:2-alkyl-3-oxoalkanoate reductase
MRVFVAGSTGAVGLRVVRLLIGSGHQVTATTRSDGKVDLLRAVGAEPVVLDGLDPIAVGAAVARARPDAIIHQMTALAGVPDMRRFDRWFAQTNRLRTRGLDHLLAAAQASGVKRLLAQSYTGWTNAPTGAAVKTEEDGLDPHPARAQTETLAAIAYLEQAVVSAPLEGIVLRYGSFYGPGGSEALVALVRKRKLPIVGGGGGVWSWIHLDDAAAATVAALDRGKPGIYNIVDDEPAPVADWLPCLAAAVGARPPLRVPTWLARLLAGEVIARVMTRSRGASNQKARRELGWRPEWSSWRQGFRHALTASAAQPRQPPLPGPLRTQDAR